MSLDTPKDNFPDDNSREAMEARLTALALGELSAEEEATLRAEMAKDPELAKLQERLARTIGLIGEAAGSLTEATAPQAEPLKLSSDRREKLLESFKVVRPKELVKRRRLNWRLKSRELAALAAMVIALLVIGATLMMQDDDGWLVREWRVELRSEHRNSLVTSTSIKNTDSEAAAEAGRSRSGMDTLSVLVDGDWGIQPRGSTHRAVKLNPALGLVDGGVKDATKNLADKTLTFSFQAGHEIPAQNQAAKGFDAPANFTATTLPAPAPKELGMVTTYALAGVPPVAAPPVSLAIPVPPPVAEAKESGREHYFAPIALPSAGDGLATADAEGTEGRNNQLGRQIDFGNSTFDSGAGRFQMESRNSGKTIDLADLDSTDKGIVDKNSANFFGDGRAKEMISDIAGKPAEVALGGQGGRDNNRPGQSSRGPAEYASVSVAPAGGARGGGQQPGARAGGVGGLDDLAAIVSLADGQGQGGGGGGGRRLAALRAPQILGTEPAGALGRPVATADGFGVEGEYRVLNRNGSFEGLEDLAQKPKADQGVFTFALVKDEVAGLKQLTQPLAIPTPAPVNAGVIAGNPTAANVWFGNEAKPAATPPPTVAGGYGFANTVPVELKAKATDPFTSGPQGIAAGHMDLTPADPSEAFRGDQGITVDRTVGAAGTRNRVQAGAGSGPAAGNPRGYRADVTGTNGTFDTGFITLTNRSEIDKFYSGTDGTRGTHVGGITLNRTNGTVGQVAVDFFAGEPALVTPGTFVSSVDPATGLPVSGVRNFGGTAGAAPPASPDDSDILLDSPLGKQRLMVGGNATDPKRFDDAVQLQRSSQLGIQVNGVSFGRPAIDRSGVDAMHVDQLAQDTSTFYRLGTDNQDPPIPTNGVYNGAVLAGTGFTAQLWAAPGDDFQSLGYQWRTSNPKMEARAGNEVTAKPEAATLAQDGKLLFESGKYVMAESKLRQALKLDPDSQGADYYLKLAIDKKAEKAANAEELTHRERILGVTKSWPDGTTRDGNTAVSDFQNLNARTIPPRTLRTQTAQSDVPVDPAVQYIDMAVQKKQVEANGRTFPPLPPLNEDEVAVKVDATRQLDGSDVQNADLSKVLKTYQELTGREVLAAPSMPPIKVNLEGLSSLSRKDAAATLETVLAQNQIQMVPQGTKSVKAVPQAQGFQEGKEFEDIPHELLPETARIVTHTVQLTNALPSDLAQILQPFGRMPQSVVTVPGTANLVLRDSPENVKRMMELVHKLDVVPQQDFVDVVIPIQSGKAEAIAQVLATLTAGGSGGSTTVGRQQSNTGLSSGGGGLGGSRGGFGSTGVPGSPGYNPKNPYGAAGGAGDRNSFAQRLNQITNLAANGTGDIFVLGQTKIIADERTSSLLVFASKQDLVTISNIVQKLDAPGVLPASKETAYTIALPKAPEENQAGRPLRIEAALKESKDKKSLAQRQLAEDESPDKKELARLLETRDRLYGRVWQEKVDQTIPRNAIVEVIDPAVAEPVKKSGLWNRVSGIFGSDSERTVKLAVEKDATDIESLGARAAGGFDPFWVQTQSEKIQSKEVLGKVIEKLNLNEAWAGKEGEKLSTDETMKLLKKRLTVRQEPNSSLWDISAKSDDPEEAARIANEVASAYRQARLDRWTSLSEKGLGVLEKEMEAHNKKITELQAKIDNRKEAATVRSRSVEMQTLEKNENEYILAQGDYERLVTTYSQLTNSSPTELQRTIATVSPDTLLTQLLQDQKAEAQKFVLATNHFSINHPMVRDTRDKLTLINRQIDERVNGIVKGLKLAADAKKATVDQLRVEILRDRTNDARQAKPAPSPAIPQPEVSTKENAFSTFSLNVSDVSFKLAAAALEKGQMPDPATVRSEEFINAFDYHDPEPKGSAPIAFVSERARYPFAHNRDLLRFSIKTAASGRLNGRPLNLVLLLDNSGSMERADRVRIIQECLRVLATQLRPEDRVSVVAFARTARLWIDGMPGNQAGELAERVGTLTPQGGTNLEEAMNLAYQTALRHFMANGVNRVVLLTDGAANLGDVQPASLKKKVETHRQQGIALDCFGIGWEGFNDDLLENLSRNGDGRYGFVNSPAAATTEFAGQLAGALQVAASDVKVQVEFNPKRVTSYRQIGYAKHQLKKEQFRDNTVDAAEIAAAEAGNALYTVEVNPFGEGPVATVRVRFKIPGSMDFREHEWTVPYEGPAKALEQSTVTLRLAGAASAFSEWLVSSPFAGEVTTDALIRLMSGVPESFSSDPRPKKLVEMLRQAKSLAGK